MHALQTYDTMSFYSWPFSCPFRLHVGIILIHGESIPILMKKKKKKERSK